MSIQDRNPVLLTPSTVRTLWSSRRKESEKQGSRSPLTPILTARVKEASRAEIGWNTTPTFPAQIRGCLGVKSTGSF